MTKTYLCHDYVGKALRYKRDAEALIDLILIGCAGSIYALEQVMMEGL